MATTVKRREFLRTAIVAAAIALPPIDADKRRRR
jgi:hypothetical protein